MFSLHIDTARTWRGGQQQVLLTVLGLREIGHRAVLVAHPDGELSRRASEGHDLLRLAPLHEVDLHAAWRLFRILKDLGPDVVHAHDPHGVALASLALAFKPSPSGPLLMASRRVAFHLKTHPFSRWKYRQVDCFVAASGAVRAILLADGIPPDRIVTIHDGIDVHRVLAEPALNITAEFWLPTHAPVVGAVGALTPEKGHRYLIDAAALVVREVPDARFVILGDGELRPALERQIKDLHLDKHVILPGFRPDVLAFHKAFDLFVMSSTAEGLGTSLLDAMACSKAIVASDTGGIPEVVVDGETGMLVPPRDVQALARAIAGLLKDGERRERMGRCGFERVQRRFTVERLVEQLVAVYRTRRDAPGRAAAGADDRPLAGGSASPGPSD